LKLFGGSTLAIEAEGEHANSMGLDGIERN